MPNRTIQWMEKVWDNVEICLPLLTAPLDVTGLKDNGIMTAFPGGWRLPFMSNSLFPDLLTKASSTDIIEESGLDCKFPFLEQV
jgi:hypothetical protein